MSLPVHLNMDSGISFLKLGKCLQEGLAVGFALSGPDRAERQGDFLMLFLMVGVSRLEGNILGGNK